MTNEQQLSTTDGQTDQNKRHSSVAAEMEITVPLYK